MDYDVIILGGGIIGCAVAYELSKYSLNIALIEKDYDIADDVALVNSAVIYDGAECKDTLMSKLELSGNKLLKNIVKKFNVPFKECGSLIIAQNDEEEKSIYEMYNRALEREIKDIDILDSDKVYQMEPNLKSKVKKALYLKDTGVICPYDLALSYGEIAFDNGVNFKLEEEVLDIQKVTKGYKVITNKNKFTCNLVINTTPGENYSVDTNEKPSKNRCNLDYFLLEHDFESNFNNIITTIGKDNNKVFSVPTVQGNTIVSVISNNRISFNEAKKSVMYLVGELKDNFINNFYRWNYYNDNIIIDDSLIHEGYIKIQGKHYAEVTMTPFIAKMVCETIVNNLNCVLKKDFIDKRREFYKFRDLNNEERNQIIKMNKNYGKIVCLCQKVTEGEIIDAIRRPLGARTVEGVKRRTGVTLGGCQGAGCLDKIVSILARETNKNMTEIVKDSKNSKILRYRIKEFDSV